MPVQTPICDFGKKALPFELKSTENKNVSLNNIKGENGTLIMFICNHCPYVKAITKELVEDCNASLNCTDSYGRDPFLILDRDGDGDMGENCRLLICPIPNS